MTHHLQEFYANIIDSVGDGVIVLDQQQRVTLMNPAAEEIAGLSRRQADAQQFSSLFKEEEILIGMVAKTAATGMTISDYENIIIKKGTHTTPVSVTTSPLLMSHGEVSGIIIVLRDLSNIRELERIVRQADRLSALGTVAAGLAHEIKNPLGGIKGAAQLLDHEIPPESELHEYTRVMIREVERINHIVLELLDLASPKKLELAKVNLHQVIGDIILLQKRTIEGKSISIQQHLDPSIPSILGDERLLTQLFLNLVKNAVEAMLDDGILKITTRIVSDYSMTKKGEKPSRMVAVDVSDTGPGIDADQQELLFTPFFTTKTGGTGLGLAICHKIVSEHRGMIKLESQKGEGTTFTVMLPFIQ